jgi:hypothetical protein
MSQTKTITLFVNNALKLSSESPMHWLVRKTGSVISYPGRMNHLTFNGHRNLPTEEVDKARHAVERVVTLIF